MSERERWIVYPLLFFALGAAVRDKILHRVDTKEVYCESLKIVDPNDPMGPAFAELSIRRSMSDDPTQEADRVGMLRLVDSRGNEVCHLDNHAIFPRVISGRLDIVDANRQLRAVTTTEPGPIVQLPNGIKTRSSQGVVYLLNQNYGIRLPAPGNRHPAPQKSADSSL